MSTTSGAWDRRNHLTRVVRDSLDGIEDWKLEAMARVARVSSDRGYGNPPFVLGLGKLELHDGVVVGELDIGEIHRAGHGAAHGMVTFGLLDNAMGQSVTLAAPDHPICVAVEIKCQYVRPVLLGPVRVEGEAVHVGGRIAVTTGRLLSGRGDLCVLATGTYYLMARTYHDRQA